MKAKKELRLHIRRRAVPGTAPGTLVRDPQAPAPVIQVIAYGPETIVETPISDPACIGDFLHKQPVTWVNVDGLGNTATLEKIGEIFHLHPLALEDIVNVHQRPKIEPYGEHYFIVARMPAAGDHFDTEQISIFMGPDFVLSFQDRPGDCLEPLRERLRRGRTRIRSAGPDYLAYALLDTVVDAYFPVLERVGEDLEDIETQMLGQPASRQMLRLHTLKRDLLTLRRAIWPLREAIAVLSREETSLITDATRIYLRDCYDHTIQLMDVIEIYREFGSGLMDFYLSSMSNRTNEIMKVLTIITTIFIPLSFIAGVYGMNFDGAQSPWNMPELRWRFGYPVVLGLMTIIAAVLLLLFKKKGWFR